MRTVLFITLLFIGHLGFAQDIIVTKKGEEIESKVVEVGIDNIKYKKFSFLDGPDYVIRKSDVIFIRFENGTKEVYALKMERRRYTLMMKSRENLIQPLEREFILVYT